MKKHILKLHPVLNSVLKKTINREVSVLSFKQFIKHYFVGGMSAIINYLIFNILMFSGFGTKLANTLTYSVVIVIAFIMQKYFTYKAKHHSIWQPILFILNTFLYYVIDTTILVILIDKLHVMSMISKLISIIILAPTSFLFQKYVVFKHRGENN